MLLLIGLNTR